MIIVTNNILCKSKWLVFVMETQLGYRRVGQKIYLLVLNS